MEPLRPYDVALCMLLRSYLCAGEADPSTTSPLHGVFGEALLMEIKRRDEAATPTLIQLLQRMQVCVGLAEGGEGQRWGSRMSLLRLDVHAPCLPACLLVLPHKPIPMPTPPATGPPVPADQRVPGEV